MALAVGRAGRVDRRRVELAGDLQLGQQAVVGPGDRVEDRERRQVLGVRLASASPPPVRRSTRCRRRRRRRSAARPRRSTPRGARPARWPCGAWASPKPFELHGSPQQLPATSAGIQTGWPGARRDRDQRLDRAAAEDPVGAGGDVDGGGALAGRRRQVSRSPGRGAPGLCASAAPPPPPTRSAAREAALDRPPALRRRQRRPLGARRCGARRAAPSPASRCRSRPGRRAGSCRRPRRCRAPRSRAPRAAPPAAASRSAAARSPAAGRSAGAASWSGRGSGRPARRSRTRRRSSPTPRSAASSSGRAGATAGSRLRTTPGESTPSGSASRFTRHISSVAFAPHSRST